VTVTVYYQSGTPATSAVDWSLGVPESDTSFQIAPGADLSSPAITVLQDGKVGIGLTAPASGLELPNTPNVMGRGRANAWVTYSSRRWKENIAPISDALQKVMRLQGVMFDWKPEHSGARDIGFVAEEVGRVV